MKRIILMIPILLMCSLARADSFNIDMSSWSQERKNMTHAMLVKGLFDNGITHDKITVDRSTGGVDIPNPSADPSTVVANIVNIYDDWKVLMDSKIVIALALEAALENERDNNVIKGLKLDQVDDWINGQVDSITNIAEAKVYLKTFSKKVVRYLKAHER